MTDERARFGRRLKRYRELRGLTQPELARRVRVHPITIAKWEGGAQEPSATKLLAISGILRVSPAVLMGRPRQETEAAIEAYLESPYYATLATEGQSLTPLEVDGLRYLIDSRWVEGQPAPRVLHALVQLMRSEPDLFRAPAETGDET